MSEERPSVQPPRLSPVLDTGMPEQPLYERVQDALRERLQSGAYRRGSRLPSERALSESYGVSRLTMRRALQDLEQAGVIERTASRGWFLPEEPMSEAPNQLLSFSEMARARGLTPSARVISATSREATLDEAEAFSIAPGAALFELERLRLMDGVPIAVDNTVLPLAVAPWLVEIDFAQESLHGLLEQHGVLPTRADVVVEVRDADERLASLLDVPVGKGLLLASGVTTDQNNRTLERGWIAYRPGRYRMRTTLVRGPS